MGYQSTPVTIIQAKRWLDSISKKSRSCWLIGREQVYPQRQIYLSRSIPTSLR